MVEFSRREEVTSWLRGKPREVATLVAARAALRVIPLLASDVSSADILRGSTAAEVILPVFRAAPLPWISLQRTKPLEIGSALIDLYRLHRDSRANRTLRTAHAVSAAANTVIAAVAYREAAGDAVASSYVNQLSYKAVSADANAIAKSRSLIDVANAPLWPVDPPSWVDPNWSRLKDLLHARDEGWDVWTSWYEARLNGEKVNLTFELIRAGIPDKIWHEGPKAANAEIRLRIKSYESAEPIPTASTVPAQNPAAVEPFWHRGKLSVPKTPAKSNLSKKKLEAAFTALRAELLELASDVNAEGNIDKRPADFLHRLASRIPETPPRQDELFRLGHAETIFAGYAKVVTQEWPDFLAARYHAVSLQFDRTMRQAPLWRQFMANAAKQTMTAAQVADSGSLATEAAKALQQEEAPAFVDPVVPRALEQLADALPVVPAPDAIDAGKELLAADLVESVNNTLKPIAEVALSAASDYTGGFGRGFKKAAKKQGPIDGEKAFKWLRRLAISGAGAGSFVALSNLIAKFPEAFGWLERVLHVLK